VPASRVRGRERPDGRLRREHGCRERRILVVSTFAATAVQDLVLVDTPHDIVDPWGAFLVSSDPSVVEVVDDVNIRTPGVGVVELGIRTDGGTYYPLYRVTVTE
jgi:hypothetical protein